MALRVSGQRNDADCRGSVGGMAHADFSYFDHWSLA